MSLFPWEGGINVNGAADVKHPASLGIAENIVYGFAGEKMRRGGQQHLNRIQVREGTAFEDHFLDLTLSEQKWPLLYRAISPNHFISTSRRTSVRVSQAVGTVGASSSIANVLKGATQPTNKMKYLVQTLSTDPDESLRQTTEINVQWRTRGDFWPSYALAGQAFVGVEVEPGRPGGVGDPEWHLHVRFGDGVLGVRNEAGTFVAPTYQTGISIGELLGHKDYHTWRVAIHRNADSGGIRHYVGDLYYEDRLIATGFQIDNDSIAGTTFVKLEWDTGGGVGTFDVEFDSIDVQAELQEIRGLYEFAENPSDQEGTNRMRAIYAGTRVYLDVGDPFAMIAIDDGLPSGGLCSFQVADTHVRPVRVDVLRTGLGPTSD